MLHQLAFHFSMSTARAHKADGDEAHPGTKERHASSKSELPNAPRSEETDDAQLELVLDHSLHAVAMLRFLASTAPAPALTTNGAKLNN
jgi:hypothetical protein